MGRALSARAHANSRSSCPWLLAFQRAERAARDECACGVQNARTEALRARPVRLQLRASRAQAEADLQAIGAEGIGVAFSPSPEQQVAAIAQFGQAELLSLLEAAEPIQI